MNKKELEANTGNIVIFHYGHRGTYLGVLVKPETKDSFIKVQSIIEYPKVELRDYLPLKYGEEVAVGNRNIKAYNGQVFDYKTSLDYTFNKKLNDVCEGLEYFKQNITMYRGKEMYEYHENQFNILLKHKKLLNL